MAKKRKTGDDSDVVKIIRISERYRTLRTAVLSLAGVICVAIVAYAFVLVSERPWWEAVIAAGLGSAALVLAPQTALFGYLRVRLKRYTSMNQERLIELECKLDPTRTSSGLLKDGTSPPEEL